MTTHILRLFEDRLAPRAVVGPLAAGHRMLHVIEGTLEAGPFACWPGPVRHVAGAPVLTSGPGGVHLLRFELLAADAGAGELDAEGADSRPLLSAEFDLDPSANWLMRCDQVDFPLGGIAYKHVYAGPGIRWLMRGGLRVEAGDHDQTVPPGQAWFEDGPTPVVARASETEETAFLRVSILPADYLGRSSITYVDAADRDKPKMQRYTMHQEIEITLGGGAA